MEYNMLEGRCVGAAGYKTSGMSSFTIGWDPVGHSDQTVIWEFRIQEFRIQEFKTIIKIL